MDVINSFTICVPDAALNDLKLRLSLARFPGELEGTDHNYGVPLGDVKRFTAYWKDKFDWRANEKKLNMMPQFTTTLKAEGFAPLKIHFVHQRSQVPTAIPLLFVHGWPGSFMEAGKIFDKLAGPTTDSRAPSFHFVALSLPNFGFSDGVKEPGFALQQYADICHKLMLKLGYKQYVTQGGDWGFRISRTMSYVYPDHCKATHLNMDEGSAPTFRSHPWLALQHTVIPYTERERKGLERNAWMLNHHRGYATQQMTKPQTLGYSLEDSPVVLLAWIYEKLYAWSDNFIWTEDEICTWVSI
jgi:pimeloyl-ACP methyl ester carboxylesterase